MYQGVLRYNFRKKLFLSLKINLVLANSADPDDILHNAAFHLGLHSLPKYRFRGDWYTVSMYTYEDGYRKLIKLIIIVYVK